VKRQAKRSARSTTLQDQSSGSQRAGGLCSTGCAQPRLLRAELLRPERKSLHAALGSA
jgi:hypothetical protein